MAKRSRSVSNKSVTVRNRQKVRSIDVRLLREMAEVLAGGLLESRPRELGIHIVAAREMARLNETFLGHQGSTDVLSFDYSQPGQQNLLCGEILVCLDEAEVQARRFRTTWQSELVRYVIHGVLHLIGHDDHDPASRRKMKFEENRLLKQLGRQFKFSEL